MSVIPCQRILAEINRARTKPSEYAKIVKEQLDSFIDQYQMPLLPNCYYSTNQGKKAWIQAYQFLSKQKPLHQYKLNDGLNLSADDHVSDLAANNLFGHTSSNGDDMTKRIQFRCGQFYGRWGQAVGSSFANVKGRDHALHTILGLIIDDGVSNRGHRKAVFSEQYKYIGASSRISQDKVITVINYHTDNLKVVNNGKKTIGGNNSNFGTNYTQNKKQPSNSFGDFGNKFNDGWGDKYNDGWGDIQPRKNHSTGQKTIVSQSTNTRTQTCNGKTTKTVTKKIKYSDGTTQQIVEEQVY